MNGAILPGSITRNPRAPIRVAWIFVCCAAVAVHLQLLSSSPQLSLSSARTALPNQDDGTVDGPEWVEQGQRPRERPRGTSSRPPPSLSSITRDKYRADYCDDELVYRTDVVVGGGAGTGIDTQEAEKMGYRIPRIVHQTFKSRCLTQEFHAATELWMFHGWSYYFHDDDAVDRLFQLDYPEFPHLNVVAEHCLKSATARADLWRYLVLWLYGGIYSDMDTGPNKMTKDTIQPVYDGFFVIESWALLSQYFFAMSPRHPLMYYAIQATLRNIMAAEDTIAFNAAFVTGPHALHDGFLMFLRAGGNVTLQRNRRGGHLEKNKDLVRNGTIYGAENRSITVYGEAGDADANVYRYHPIIAKKKRDGMKRMGMILFGDFHKKAEYKSNMTCYDFVLRETRQKVT
jgi:inositol phosphorylceramide mannosyltransferase catalytic subunit